MVLTEQETRQIVQLIQPIFQSVLGEYDFGKYPADRYSAFQKAFSELSPAADQINDALLWKWGHWGKMNFPQAQQNLIQEIQGNWQRFCSSGEQHDPEKTFQWWKKCLNRNTTYITQAYITHLIHHKKRLPIIDQHNFRAMNNLILAIRPGFSFKKKPSDWQDIQNLQNFMLSICAAFKDLSFSDLDKFLMMYGRRHVPR